MLPIRQLDLSVVNLMLPARTLNLEGMAQTHHHMWKLVICMMVVAADSVSRDGMCQGGE